MLVNHVTGDVCYAVNFKGIRGRLRLVASLTKPQLTDVARGVFVLQLNSIWPKSSTLTPATQLGLVVYPITQLMSVKARAIVVYSMEINVKFDSVYAAFLKGNV